MADGNRFDDEADYQSIIDDDPAFATVAMEYSAVDDVAQCPVPQPGVNACAGGGIPAVGPKIMKFFTYAGDGNADGGGRCRRHRRFRRPERRRSGA
ncbi:hypothetical protein GE300_11905 [Rhodobacteraceae bacterium 2CG4]|uniref:Uncharacterized protein n=1 Tax=Halovulum marinum TaxID=2662447 RepID=A0A6L5Z2K8_9RHOB|nr:hypothetical protein [Halovulum marinum]MSU90315.1 hypothetical protein [Halovulum marinum]